MENQLNSVSKIFTEKIYRIPDYQRGYAWIEKQIKDFWNDILQLENEKNHYLGVLTLESVSSAVYTSWSDDLWIIKSKSFQPFYIVDGQQRLTTTIILLQAILESVGEKETLNYDSIEYIKKKYIFDTKDGGLSRSYIFGYEKDNPSYEYLKTKIFLETSASGYSGEETIYTTNLNNAKLFFLEKLKSFSASEIAGLYKKVTQNLLFNIYTIHRDIDVFVTFETMNNRGKPLSNLELLKNRLIYLSTKLNSDDHDKAFLRKQINEAWKGTYHFLGKNKERPLNDDAFLRAHYLLFFIKGYKEYDDEVRGQAIYRDLQGYNDRLLDEIFTVKRIYQNSKGRLTGQEISRFSESLVETVKIWFYIYNPLLDDFFPADERILLDKISRLKDFYGFAPLLVILYQKKKIRKTTRIAFLIALERFQFVKSLLYYSDFEFRFDEELVAYALLNNVFTIETYLKTFEENLEVMINSERFLQKVKRRFEAGGYYQWELLRYFLYEYEIYIKKKAKNETDKISWAEFRTERDDFLTVEHIYPQKPADAYWKSRFEGFGIKQKRQLSDSLGNLLALSNAKNASLQNYRFPLKVEGSKEYVGYKFGSYSEIEVSSSKDWTSREILERGIKLLKFMEENWRLKLGNNKTKAELLNLGFLVENK